MVDEIDKAIDTLIAQYQCYQDEQGNADARDEVIKDVLNQVEALIIKRLAEINL